MSFYIVYNNISSFFDAKERLNSIEINKAAVTDTVEKAIDNVLVEKAIHDVSADGQITVLPEPQVGILPEVDDSFENLVFAIDDGKTAAVPAQQILQTIKFNTETSEPITEKQSSKSEAENVVLTDVSEEFHLLLKKYEISLQYRYDFTDVLDDNRETEQSQHFNKLIEKNFNKQQARQQEDFEKRFQEKQAESFREYLKQK